MQAVSPCFVLAKGGNTSNLLNHLKTMHVREYEEYSRMHETVSPGVRPKTSQTPTLAINQVIIRCREDEQKMERHSRCNNTSHREGHGTHSNCGERGFQKVDSNSGPKI